MKTYIVWNQYKANEAETYTALVAEEKSQNGSISSRIESDDIKALLFAVYNETNVDLLYREVIRYGAPAQVDLKALAISQAEAPDGVDVEHEEPMLYLGQVLTLLEGIA